MRKKEEKESIPYLEFKTEKERRIFADAIASIPKIQEVIEKIAENKAKNRGFNIDVKLNSLAECGLDPLVKLHFKKVRNQDNTYDLDFTFNKMPANS